MQAASQQAAQQRGQNLESVKARNDAMDRFNQMNTQRRVDAAQQAFDNRLQTAAGRTNQLSGNAAAGDARRAQSTNILGSLLSSYIGSAGAGRSDDE